LATSLAAPVGSASSPVDASDSASGSPASIAVSSNSASSARRLAEAAALARGRTRDALSRLAELWTILEDPALQNPGDMIRRVVERHYGEYADRNFPNAAARKDDLEQFAGYAERYPAASEFLGELALIQGISAENVLGAEQPDDMLVLSTIHQAKGLEWPVCFVLWLAEGRFPMATAMRQPSDIEEERRLFYVAVTRAGDELYMTYPVIEETRDGPSHMLRPSKFLIEVDTQPAVFERWQIEEAPADPVV
jgi:DNA helicase-2/ATP-dependent DNA helicase PcrA